MAESVIYRRVQAGWIGLGVAGILSGGLLLAPAGGISLPPLQLLAVTTWHTFELAAVVTTCCLVLGFPLALLMSGLPARWERWLYSLILIPVYVNPLVLAFAFLLLLREGPLASALRSVQPTGLYNWGCVVVTMTYFLVPFLVLPIRVGLAGLDPELVAAARSLGAGPRQAVWRVVLPVLRPHLVAGSLLVFLQAASYFVVPILLGGGWIVTLPVQAAGRLQLGLTGEAYGVVLVLMGVSMLVLWAGRGAWASRLPMTGRSTRVVPPLGGLGKLLSLAICAPPLLPPLVITVAALNPSRYPSLFPAGLSLRWFHAVLSSSRWHDAAAVSATVAVMAAVLAAAFLWPIVLDASEGRGVSSWSVAITVVPLVIPPVAFAIGCYPVLSRLGLLDTRMGLALGEAWLVYPIAALPLMSAVASIRPEIALAARNLGATRRKTAALILLPRLWPAAVAGTLLAALTAGNEVVLPIFWTSWRIEPLSRLLWDGMRYEIDPRGLAAGTLLLGGTLLIAALWFILERGRSLHVR